MRNNKDIEEMFAETWERFDYGHKQFKHTEGDEGFDPHSPTRIFSEKTTRRMLGIVSPYDIE